MGGRHHVGSLYPGFLQEFEVVSRAQDPLSRAVWYLICMKVTKISIYIVDSKSDFFQCRLDSSRAVLTFLLLLIIINGQNFVGLAKDLQCVLKQFNSKSKARKRVACSLLGAECLPRVDEFNCHEVLFTSGGKVVGKVDSLFRETTAVMRLMYWSVVVKKNPSQKVML